MAALTLNSIRLCTLALGVALALAAPALAADVTVQLDAGDGFSIKDSTGATERLRVDEATGNLSRNGALFVHTTGLLNTFVGLNAGNLTTTGSFNSAFGRGALFYNTTGDNNSAVGLQALIDNTTGDSNSAVGVSALQSNTTGDSNSAVGAGALQSNSTGFRNSAVGLQALVTNTTGGNNSAVGGYALRFNSTGSYNSAVGVAALQTNTTGFFNSAVGYAALRGNTQGNRNVAVGFEAGLNQTTGSNNIYLANTGVASESGKIKIGTSGTHTKTTIAGIRGVTTDIANAIPVLIDSTGQLGTTSSSRSVKKEVRDMGDATDRLLALRPVMFRYRQEQTVPSGELPPEYGLIAEEVAEVFPDLVVYDEAGLPFTVKYHVMAPMLLNEMKKQQQVIAVLSSRIVLLEHKARAGSASEGAIR